MNSSKATGGDKPAKRKRGRPRKDDARRNKMQICFGDPEIDRIAAALEAAHESQQDLEPRDRVSPSRLLSELVMLAMGQPELIRAAAAAHRAEHEAQQARRKAVAG